MKKKLSLGFVFLITIFMLLPMNVKAEDLLVKSELPKYEVVVGRDITYTWR
jgi:hypothetical protein